MSEAGRGEHERGFEPEDQGKEERRLGMSMLLQVRVDGIHDESQRLLQDA